VFVMREEHGNVAPALVQKGEDLGNVRIDVPYQLVNILETVYPSSPGKIAVLTRRCDEKALAELFKRGLLDEARIVMIGLACSKEQIRLCRCEDPVPSRVVVGEPNAPAKGDELETRLSGMTPDERLKFWTGQFRKCNKCFACTTNCPVCFCDECILEDRTFVPEKGIPPGLSFHLIRSFHLADKCIECGECERSCPASIPLLTLRKMALKDVKGLFNYRPGEKKTTSPLLTTLDDQPLAGEGCDEC